MWWPWRWDSGIVPASDAGGGLGQNGSSASSIWEDSGNVGGLEDWPGVVSLTVVRVDEMLDITVENMTVVEKISFKLQTSSQNLTANAR